MPNAFEIIQNTLDGSPYNLSPPQADGLLEALAQVKERVLTLRQHGKLSAKTLERYYGKTRFEQVAESNAIEGSTLTVGDTELAVLKGVTLTGHDPAFVRDAVSLDKALARLAEMAKKHVPTDLTEIKELHEIILDGHAGAGSFRSEPVRISGSDHRPPRTWKEVMDEMEKLETWSIKNKDTDPILRAVVLHAWFVHIHPFRDGNGRTARAITNLELIRQGYPSIIVRRHQDRDRYIASLRESDLGGDVSLLAELFIERFQGALIGLEAAAKEIEGYDPVTIKIREAQQRKLDVWNRSVDLLFQVVIDRLTPLIENAGGNLSGRVYRDSLSLDEYLGLCRSETVSMSWAFSLKASVPGLAAIERLAWIGFQNPKLRQKLGTVPASPAIYWSKRNPNGYPTWIQTTNDELGIESMTITPGEGDRWHVLRSDNSLQTVSTSELGHLIATGIASLVAT
jgi:Fic family protein